MENAIAFATKKAVAVELKEKQKECLQRFLEGRHVFGSLPTSYGKFLIYKNVSSCSPVHHMLSRPPHYLQKALVLSPSPYHVEHHRSIAQMFTMCACMQ